MAAPLLSARGITKRFGATVALDNVAFDLAPGEVHALVGENGAGKSTMMNVVSGVIQPDAGELSIEGRPTTINSPRQAQALGIATVFQELSLVGAVSIAENIFAGRTPSRSGLVNWGGLNRQAEAILSDLGVSLDVGSPVANVPVTMRQIVEIAKAISLDARILLLDEPTAALTTAEARRLFQVIARLQARGIGIVYISHHLPEVLRIADRITVLRDGRVVATRRPAETSQASLVRDMVGRELAGWSRHCREVAKPVLLEAQGLGRQGEYRDVSLEIRAGEIVGIAGLMGSFRGQLGRSLCGILQPSAGQIRLRGRPARWRGLRDAMRERVAYVPEERKSDGLFLEMPVTANIAVASLPKVSRAGLFSRTRATRMAQRAVERFRIKAPDVSSAVGGLSGGNQQKLLLARWLETEPDVLIVDEPTRGVDVGSKSEIHGLLAGLAERGAGILVISSDLIELISLADRILVMHSGRIVGEVPALSATEEEIVALASGLPRGDTGAAA